MKKVQSSATVEKNYGERTSLFCVVHSRGGATGHKGARRRAAAICNVNDHRAQLNDRESKCKRIKRQLDNA